MGLFYTGKGDKGESDVGPVKSRGDHGASPEKSQSDHVVNQRKILVKDSVISEALGGLDELNSLLGLVKHQNISGDFIKLLEEAQESLFIVQANVANALFQNADERRLLDTDSRRSLDADERRLLDTDSRRSEMQTGSNMDKHKNMTPAFDSEKVKKIEKIIDELEHEVNPARNFVLPGTTPSAGWLDYTRAVCRRVERGVVTFSKKYELAPEILAFMNRLSSLLYAMARADVKRSGVPEKHPRYK